MFDIGWPELFVIALVALVVIGPKELPRVMRQVGRWFGKAKRMTWEFRRHWDDVMRESELDDVKRQIQAATSADPASYVENTIDPDRKLREAIEFGGEELVNVKMPPMTPDAIPAVPDAGAPQTVTTAPKDPER
jgi:sec-independent protein translocase protein TatB